jgi:hypothetical protein
MKLEARDKRDRDDLQYLLRLEQFRRFYLRVIQTTGFFDTATNGSQHDAAVALARRNLGLELLAMVDSGQPVQHPDGLPVLTLIQLLREEANPPPQENKRDRRTDQYNRNRDLDESDD